MKSVAVKFEPIQLSPDLDPACIEAYGAIADDLVKITSRAVEVESERRGLVALPPDEVGSSETLDRSRKLSSELLELLTREMELRASKLELWFGGSFASAVAKLRGQLTEGVKAMRQDVRQKLIGMGYTSATIADAHVNAMPAVEALNARIGRLDKLASALDNPNSDYLAWAPQKANRVRCEQIRTALKGARERAAAPLAQAAFV